MAVVAPPQREQEADCWRIPRVSGNTVAASVSMVNACAVWPSSTKRNSMGTILQSISVSSRLMTRAHSF